MQVYKEQTNYYDQFTEANHEKPEVIQKAEYEAPATSTSSSKAPQATTKQQVQQVQNNTPSNDDMYTFEPQADKVKAEYEAAGDRVVSREEFFASEGGREIACANGETVYILPGK